MNQSIVQGNLDLGNYVKLQNHLTHLVCSERPQRRMENFGASSLSDTELIALLLGAASRHRDVVTISMDLLSKAGSLAQLASWQAADFRQIKGIGPAKAQRLMAIAEIARRTIIQRQGEAPILSRAEAVAEFLKPYASALEVEKFWALCLNRKNRLIKCVEVTSGTATNSLVHPREVFRPAIREGASAVICAHNHPSGDPSPSTADIQVTRQLRDAAKTLCIDLLDHVIVGRAETDPNSIGFYSFRTAGLI